MGRGGGGGALDGDRNAKADPPREVVSAQPEKAGESPQDHEPQKTNIRSCGDLVKWWDSLKEAYGWKLLTLLFCAQWVLKGFVYHLVLTSSDWILKAYGVTGPRMQVYKAVAGLPWAMKPVFGWISDYLPIFGYNKAPYVFAVAIPAVICYGVVGFAPEKSLALVIVVLSLFFGAMQVSITDLLSEARYAEAMRAVPLRGPDLMTYVWFGISVGGLIATIVVGPVIENYGPEACFVICIIPAALILLPTVLNFFEERPKTALEIAATRARLGEQVEITCLVFVLAISTLVMLVVALVQDNVLVNVAVAIPVGIIVAISFTVLTQPMIGKMNAFFFIQTSLSIPIDGAAFYFFTDGPEEYPEGPHFSIVFYTTVLGIVAHVFSLIGMCIYQGFLKDCKYRVLFVCGNVMGSVLHFISIFIYTRQNVEWGIPDTFFVVSTSVLWQVVHNFMWIPGIVLLSQLCPRAMEATMYALLAGTHNLGRSVGEYIGAAVLYLLGVNPNGSPNESHQFENLWIAASISCVTPVVAIFLVFCMIPDAYQTEKLLSEDSTAVDDSPFRRMTGARLRPRPDAGYGATDAP